MENFAVRFPELHKADIVNVEVPAPQPGEILVKTRMTMISIGTEMTAYTGEFPEGSVWARICKLPVFPGYNNIGEIIDVGEGVDKKLIGKRIASRAQHRKYFTTPLYYDLEIGDRTIPQAMETFIEVPEGVTDEEAVFFTIPEIVMNGIRRSELVWGERVAVFGAGLLGQFTARICRLAGALPLFVSDVSDKRLEMLPDDPGIVKVNPMRDNIVEVIKDHCNGRLADIGFEITGKASLIHGQLQALRRSGRLVILSSPRDKVEFDFHDDSNYISSRIIGAHVGSHPLIEQNDSQWTRNRHARTYFEMLQYKQLDVKPLISKITSFENAPELYKALDENRGDYMGMLMDWR